MAKDKTGFMSASLGNADAPVAPSGQLLEQAGAYRGKAAEIDGIRTAEAITFATSTGKAAYEGYVESEAANKAANVTEGLNTPTFVGPVAAKRNEQMAMLEEARAAGRLVGEPTPELIKEWDDRALAISQAAAGKVFSQSEANARLAVDMRNLIAQHPAQAARIREVYKSYTGVGDWNTRQIEGALTAKQQEDAAAKRRERLLERDAGNISDSGIAKMFGMANSNDVYQHLSGGTDTGVQMYSAMVATNMVKNANKQLTEGDMNTAYNVAVAGGIAAGAATTQVVATRLRQQGIDLENLGTVTPDKEERLRAAYLEVKSAERKQIEGALVTIKDRIARDPTMDAATVNNTIKMLEDRLKIPLSTDINEQLNQLRLGVTSRLQTAQTAQAALGVVESGLNSMFDKDLVAKMKNGRTRKELMAANPTNRAIQELGRMLESGQANFSSTMGQMSAIANHLLNPGASTANAGAYTEAATTEQGKQDIAAQIKLIKDEGVKVLDAYTPASEVGGRSAVVTAEHFILNKEWNSLFRSVMGETYKNVLKNTPELITQFEQRFAARAKYHLTTTLPNEIKESLNAIPGISMSVVNGRIEVSGEPQSGTMSSQLRLQQSVFRANELLLAYNQVTKGEYDVKAFMASVMPQQAATTTIPANSLTGDIANVPTKPIGGTGVKNAITVAPPGAAADTVRVDGTIKGPGFLGELKRPDGKVSTEISIGVNMGGKEMEIPTLVPTLTQSEIKHLLDGKKPTDAIVDKAVAHAKKRMDEGKSVFKEAPKTVQQVGELSLAPEMAAKYNQQKTLKGKVEVLLEAGIPESTIEAAIRGPVADVLSGKREAPDSNKTSWWKQ